MRKVLEKFHQILTYLLYTSKNIIKCVSAMTATHATLAKMTIFSLIVALEVAEYVDAIKVYTSLRD